MLCEVKLSNVKLSLVMCSQIKFFIVF